MQSEPQRQDCQTWSIGRHESPHAGVLGHLPHEPLKEADRPGEANGAGDGPAEGCGRLAPPDAHQPAGSVRRGDGVPADATSLLHARRATSFTNLVDTVRLSLTLSLVRKSL